MPHGGQRMPGWADHLETHRERFLNELIRFLAIPSVSSATEHRVHVHRAADWVEQRLRQAGLTAVTVLNAGPFPVVYGEWTQAPGRPTVLIYGHFDVEAAGRLADWTFPPFEPVVTRDRIYARGASDDKGNMLIPILAAEALLQTEGALPLNVKFLFEGQEELGSPHLPAFLQAHRDLLRCDVVLSSDGGLYSEDQPAITLSSRGFCALEITVEALARDVHSGVYGGTVPNAVHALVRLLDSLRYPDGTVAVAGFYDGVSEPERVGKVPFHEGTFRQQAGAQALVGEPGYSTLERSWFRPTLEVNGIWGGSSGEGVQAIIPARAGAKLSCRLVAGQEPAFLLDQLEAHLTRCAPPGVRVDVTRIGGACRPYRIQRDHPVNLAAHAVLEEIYGMAPVYVGTGASVPVYALFQDLLGVDTVTFGFGCDDENLHAPDEFLRLKNWLRGQHAYCRLLEELARPALLR